MDTVYRWSETEFTGIPIAKTRKGIWYWPTLTDAKQFAECYGLPTDRIIEYQRGFAIQLHKSGPYVETPKST